MGQTTCSGISGQTSGHAQSEEAPTLIEGVSPKINLLPLMAPLGLLSCDTVHPHGTGPVRSDHSQRQAKVGPGCSTCLWRGLRGTLEPGAVPVCFRAADEI